MKQLVRQQRQELYLSGHRNLNMALAEQTIERIDVLKKRFQLRSRDQAVARIIRRALEGIDPGSLILRATNPETRYFRISPIVAGELVDYVKQVQRRFHNIGYGPVFEMLFEQVGDELTIPRVTPDITRAGP